MSSVSAVPCFTPHHPAARGLLAGGVGVALSGRGSLCGTHNRREHFPAPFHKSDPRFFNFQASFMNIIAPDTIVTESALAALAGVSARRIRQLIEAGDLERVAPGRLALGPSVRQLIDLAAGTGSELQRERTRAVRAQADMRELELAKARGQVASIDNFERVTTARNAVIRINMLNVVQRAALQLVGETDETAFKRKLRAEITLALQSAAETTLQLEELSDAEADA